MAALTPPPAPPVQANRLYFNQLHEYTSYDDAWLGPILYPLSLALIAQAAVYFDIIRNRHSGRKPCLPPPRAALLKGEALAPDCRVELTVMIVMLAETLFAVACIVQCSINFANRRFVGLDSACDMQAFYATYYAFSSIGLAAFGTVVGQLFVTTSGEHPLLRRSPIISAGVAVHALSLFIAALPLMGAGGYQFSKDYCMYQIEGAMYTGLLLTWFFVCAAAVIRSVAKVVAWAKGSTAPPLTLTEDNVSPTPETVAAVESQAVATAPDRTAAASAEPSFRRSVRRLAVLGGSYFIASNLTTVVIPFLYIARGQIASTNMWPVYGYQAIILHTNQLVVPILFGWQWRLHMQAAITSNKVSPEQAA